MVNIYERLLEVFSIPHGGIDSHESGSTAAIYSNPSFTKRGAGNDVLAGKE